MSKIVFTEETNPIKLLQMQVEDCLEDLADKSYKTVDQMGNVWTHGRTDYNCNEYRAYKTLYELVCAVCDLKPRYSKEA